MAKKPKHNPGAAMWSNSRRHFLRNATLALPIVIFPGFNALARDPEHFVQRTIYTMGTMVSIQAYGRDIQILQSALHRAFNEVRRLDSLLSIYQSGSDICRINAAAGESAVEVSPQTIEVVRQAYHFSTLTGGIFDCTVEPLLRLWGFRDPTVPRKQPPTDRDIHYVLDTVGYKQISINERHQKIGLLKNGGAIDLGGIAVGYTVDRMAAILRAEGIERALINHSGDIYAIGSPPNSDGWQIGIPSLINAEEIVHKISLKDAAISTSSSIEKYIDIDDKRYGHILDPFQGIPSANSSSVSVTTQLSIFADVFSTTLYSCNGAKIIKKNNGTKLEVIYVDINGHHRNETLSI